MADVKTWWLDADAAIPKFGNLPAAANSVYEGGRLAWSDASGNAIPSSAITPTSKCWGIYLSHVDNSTATPGPGNSGLAGGVPTGIPYGAGVALLAGDGTVSEANIGAYVYLYSDTGTGKPTVTLNDNGGQRPLVGYVFPYVRSSSDVDPSAIPVAVGLARPDVLDPELSAGSTAFKARGVATNLAALTFTAGTFSANANGALSAQDGLTVAVNDIIVFPAGTITTGVVSAANSGPWIITSVGGASAKFTGIRPDWWPHGGTIAVGSAINIGGGGTLFGGTRWKSFADSGIVIGTGDPALYPEEVTQQVTLVAGTKTISNVPIFSTARLGLAVAMVGGTPDATTTGYNFRITSGRVAGGIGTASAIVDAQATAGGAKVAGDVAVLNVTLIQG